MRCFQLLTGGREQLEDLPELCGAKPESACSSSAGNKSKGVNAAPLVSRFPLLAH